MSEASDTGRTWKIALFVLINLFLILGLGLILDGFQRVLQGEDPLLLAGILVGSAVFLVIGVVLLVLNRFYHILTANAALPFIAFVLIVITTLLNVTDATLWFGVVTCGVLIIASVITTILNLANDRRG